MTYDNGKACCSVTHSVSEHVCVCVCLCVCVCVCFSPPLALLFICFDGVLSSPFFRACFD